MTSRLALGTAQFGMPYGLAGNPMMAESEMAAILDHAKAHGITMLDTAPVYGEAEARLGRYGMRTSDMEWQVISKLPPLPQTYPLDVKTLVRKWVRSSLENLKLPRLHALLLHRPQDLLGPHGAQLTDALTLLKTQGLVSHLGVSIEGPELLGDLLPIFPVEIVQAPFNVLDRRLADSGWLARLHTKGIKVHVRSVFLQGLLLMSMDKLPPMFNKWLGVWSTLLYWRVFHSLTPIRGCLGFVLAYPEIDRIIVGVDGCSQLQEILNAQSCALPIECRPSLSRLGDITDLITPSRWSTL